MLAPRDQIFLLEAVRRQLRELLSSTAWIPSRRELLAVRNLEVIPPLSAFCFLFRCVYTSYADRLICLRVSLQRQLDRTLVAMRIYHA